MTDVKAFPILYSHGKKGEIRAWQVVATYNSVRVYHGVLGKGTVYNERIVQGKNIGRANETTPFEQACREAEAKFILKKRKGYSITIPSDSYEPRLPMLAQKYETHAGKVQVGDPVIYQPKLDGARMVSYWEDGALKLTSRTGVELNLPTLASELEKILPTNMMFDGEVFITSLMEECADPLCDVDAFQTTMKLIKKIQAVEVPQRAGGTRLFASEDLEYHVYDAFLFDNPSASYSERQVEINDILLQGTTVASAPHVLPVGSICSHHSPRSMQAWHDRFVAEGYEGLMLRVGDCPYRFKHRSADLLKYKTFMTEEFKIVGFEEGVGTRSGCVIWVVEVSPKVNCKVAMTGPVSFQRQLLSDAESYMGQPLTVKFQGYTGEGSLRFPVGLNLREDWDT